MIQTTAVNAIQKDLLGFLKDLYLYYFLSLIIFACTATNKCIRIRASTYVNHIHLSNLEVIETNSHKYVPKSKFYFLQELWLLFQSMFFKCLNAFHLSALIKGIRQAYPRIGYLYYISIFPVRY